MKKYRLFLIAAMSAVMLASCADTNADEQDDDVTTTLSSVSDETETAAVQGTVTAAAATAESTTTEAVETPKPANADVVPVISIQTVNGSSSVMDFVTKPVDKFVSASIASWTPGYKMPPAPYYEACRVTLTDTDGSVLIGNAEADVKVRGNWTTSYDKKPLRIKFSEKQELLGLNSGAKCKNWVLLAEYKDGSMLRNKTALSISREILGKDGLYSADSKLVEVEINGQYWGMYLLTEQQQVNSSRINISQPKKDEKNTDIGYFLEFDGYFSNEDELHGFKMDYAGNAALTPFDGNGGSGRTMKCLPEGRGDRKKEVGITIKSDITCKEQRDFIASYMNNVYNIMYAAAYKNKAYVFDAEYKTISETDSITPRQAVERVVDTASLADMYIISELTCDADIYWSSFYMSVDFGAEGSRRLRFEAPWDFDSSMGNKDRCADGKGFYAANIVPDVNGGPYNGGEYETINPWLAVLMYQDWFQDIIKEKWTAAYDGGVFDRAVQQIAKDKTQFAKAFERNYSRWNNIINNSSFANELSYEAAACRNYAQAADFLADWLTQRTAFLNKYWHK